MEWFEVRDELLFRQPVAPDEAATVAQTGIYAWYDTRDALKHFYPKDFPPVDATLPLYVGLAAKDTLAARIVGTHMVNTRRSGLRRSLAALLHDELGLTSGVVPYPKGKFDLAPQSEAKLTGWMRENGIGVTWVTHEEPTLVEKSIIRGLLSPLNFTYATGSPYRGHMKQLRSALRATALA